MAGKGDYLEHLARVPLFTSLSKRDLQKIAKAVEETSVEKGVTLVEQGSSGKEAFVIVNGTASVKRNGKKVATLGPGAVVGELSLLDRGPRTASVIADSDLTFLVIDQRHFWGLIEDVPAVAHKLLSTLAGRIRELDRQSFG
ncbi:MAG: cyclic nucleotide-binding domain-containing protein [Acidimicrobiia bacterium]